MLAGRSSPFEEEVTFWPLAQMVYREIDRDRGAPEDEVADLLRAFVAEWVDDDDVDEAARRLALALGVSDGDGEEGRYHAAEVRRGLLSLLSGVASRGPVVLVFEDLHEADPLLLDLIEQLVKDARKVAAHGAVRGALGVPGGPARLGGRDRRRRDPVGGAAHAGDTPRSSRWRPGDFANEEAEAGGSRTRAAIPFFIVEIDGHAGREERDSRRAVRPPPSACCRPPSRP